MSEYLLVEGCPGDVCVGIAIFSLSQAQDPPGKPGRFSLTTAAQVAKCAALRLPAAPLDELTATKQALRSLAPRIKTLTAEAADLQTSIRGLVEAVAPHLLDQPGVGPVTAAQIYIAWSHPGRCRNEAAFARLAGVAPLEASSGQNTRHRLNRRGDRHGYPPESWRHRL